MKSALRVRDESPLGEGEEIEQAANLLEVASELDLDRYLGNLISRAGKTSGALVSSALGRLGSPGTELEFAL